MRSLFIILVLSIIIGGCGKKCTCPADPIGPAFVGYNYSEVDTLYIKRYQKGSNFSQVIDSFSVAVGNSYVFTQGDTITISSNSFDRRMTYEYDWQLTNPFDNRVERISDIEIQLQETRCGGLFSMDRQPCSSPITSFKRNGVTVTLPAPAPGVSRGLIIKK